MEENASSPLTEGSVPRKLFVLAGPIVLANLLQTVYQLADTFWVGRLGAEAVAAVSLGFPVIFLMIALGGGFAVAGTILVAHNTGREDPRRVDYVAAQTLTFVFGIALVLSVVGYLVAGPVMQLIGAEGAVLPLAAGYLRVVFAGLVFLFVYLVFQALLRGVGDVKTPLYIVAGTVVLNFALDPFFIMGYEPFPALGVQGAALATIVSRGLGAVVALGLLFSGRLGIHLSWSDFKPDPQVAWRMIRLGFPASMEQSARALGLSFMVVLVAAFDSTIVAAYGIGVRVLSFVIIPALGLSRATSTLVGQNMGAGKIDRAERTTWLSAGIAFATLTAAGVVAFVFARPLIAVFVPGERAVIAAGARFLRTMAFFFGFVGLQQAFNGAFRGSGNTFISMMLAFISLWMLRFPLAFLLSQRTALGAAGLWWAFPASNVAAGLIAAVWFWRGTWKEKEMTRQRELRERVMAEVESDVEGYE